MPLGESGAGAIFLDIGVKSYPSIMELNDGCVGIMSGLLKWTAKTVNAGKIPYKVSGIRFYYLC